MTDNSLQLLDEQSKAFVECGYFNDIKSQAQAKVKVWIGREIGLSDFQSLTGIYITPKGQIGLMANVMSSLVKRSKIYDYSVEKLDDTECILKFLKNEKEIGVSTFNLKDAAKCGLINKETFKSYPRNMLFARALSNGARWFCPETIGGYYVIDELDDSPTKKTIQLNNNGVNRIETPLKVEEPNDIPFDPGAPAQDIEEVKTNV